MPGPIAVRLASPQLSPTTHQSRQERGAEQDAVSMAERALAGDTPPRTGVPRPTPTPPGQGGLSVLLTASSGEELDEAVREKFEARFGHSFADVRVHTGEAAARSAEQQRANAFTYGRDIFFGRGQYAPANDAGHRLLAHELAHVVQQRSGYPLIQRQSKPTQASDRRVDSTSLGRTVPLQLLELQPLINQYQALKDSGALTIEEISEVDRALQRAVESKASSEAVADAGGASKNRAAGSLALAGGLLADDATGIGVADDVLIPFALVAAGAFAVHALATRNSGAEIERARTATRDAISEAAQAIGQILLAQQVGDVIRGQANQLVIHLARLLGATVAGKPPDHQQDPNRDKNHWWTEIKNFLKTIQSKGLSQKQLLRELRKAFNDKQLTEIREALRKAFEMFGEGPPNFPPAF